MSGFHMGFVEEEENLEKVGCLPCYPPPLFRNNNHSIEAFFVGYPL